MNFRTDMVWQFALGLIYPFLLIAFSVGFFAMAFAALPDNITVLFSTGRAPIVSVSTPIFVAGILSVLVAASVSCFLAAFNPFKMSPALTVLFAEYGGFFVAVAAVLMVGAALIHEGLADWRDSVGPGWWILVPVVGGICRRSLRNIRLVAYQ